MRSPGERRHCRPRLRCLACRPNPRVNPRLCLKSRGEKKGRTSSPSIEGDVDGLEVRRTIARNTENDSVAELFVPPPDVAAIGGDQSVVQRRVDLLALHDFEAVDGNAAAGGDHPTAAALDEAALRRDRLRG